MDPLILTITTALAAGATIASSSMISEAAKDIYTRLKNTLFHRNYPTCLQDVEQNRSSTDLVLEELPADLMQLERRVLLQGFALASSLIELLNASQDASSTLAQSGIRIEEIIAKRDVAVKDVSSDELILITGVTAQEGNVTIENIRSTSLGKPQRP